MEIQKLAYTMREGAAATGHAESVFREKVTKGEIKSFKSGRRRLISARALQEFIERLERESGSAA